MGKRKLITGIIVGASVGGLVTLFNQEARDYAKDGLCDLKDKATDYIENPSTAITQVKDIVHQITNLVGDNADGAINAIEQVENTVNKFIK